MVRWEGKTKVQGEREKEKPKRNRQISAEKKLGRKGGKERDKKKEETVIEEMGRGREKYATKPKIVK